LFKKHPESPCPTFTIKANYQPTILKQERAPNHAENPTMIRIPIFSFLLIAMAITSTTISAESNKQHSETIKLGPELLALLRAEMREITVGVQKIPVAIAQGDWETLAQTSESIRSSYIMAKTLTSEQKQTLKSTLPARFKQLDSAFHSRAGQLAEAAHVCQGKVSGVRPG
jgi:hypothetical protein